MDRPKEPEIVRRNKLIGSDNYVSWLSQLKSRYQQGQIKAAIKVNTEMLQFYWGLGRDIIAIDAENIWGSGFFNQLSLDLKAIFPIEKGFSVTNIKYMKRWYLFYHEQVIIRKQALEEMKNQIRNQVGDDLESVQIAA